MRVLAIGDTHFPAVHPGYYSFCGDVYDKYNCNRAVHIGDVVDWHSISRFLKQPEADAVLTEFELARAHIKRWNRTFDLEVTEGNHDLRLDRQAAEGGIPARFLKGYNELFGCDWKWKTEIVIDGVYYFHGTGASGKFPAVTTMEKMLMSTVMGHVHSAGGIWWHANPEERLFGMNVGCGVDDHHIAFKYGENMKVRSILSAAVVIDGTPTHIIMKCGRGEKYHRSRFE